MVNELKVKLEKSKEGMIAQSLDNPEIIVTGSNKTEIKSELKEILLGYVEAYPETKKEFFVNNKMIDVKFIDV